MSHSTTLADPRLPPQPPVPALPIPSSVKFVHGGVYTLVNSHFRTVLNMNTSNFRVTGHARNMGYNQQWIFEEQAAGGWVLRNRACMDRYLGAIPTHMRADGTDVAAVPYGEHILWDIQPADGGTVRVACYDAKITNIALSKNGEGINGRKVVLRGHAVDGEHQRWELLYMGLQEHTQTPTNGGLYSIINSFSKTALHLDTDLHVVGYAKNDEKNQEWIFEQVGADWAIRSNARKDLYLGQRYGNLYNGSPLTGVGSSNRVIWAIQPAIKDTVRIAPHNYQSMNLDLNKWGGGANGTSVVFRDQATHGDQQRWTLKQVQSHAIAPTKSAQESTISGSNNIEALGSQGEKTEADKLTATGRVRSVKGCFTRLSGAFMIKGQKHSLNIAFSPSVPEFKCEHATIWYSELKVLTATRALKGKVTTTKITIDFDGGTRITGTFENEIDVNCTITGNGTWIQE